MKLNALKKGDFFTLKPIPYPMEDEVWIKGDYDRSTKEFSCHRFDDFNHERFFKAIKEVYTDITF